MGNLLDDHFAARDAAQAETKPRVTGYEAALAAQAAGLKMREEAHEISKSAHELNKSRIESEMAWQQYEHDQEVQARNQSAQAIRELATLKEYDPHWEEAIADIQTRLPFGTKDERFGRAVAVRTSIRQHQQVLIEAAESKSGIPVPRREEDNRPDWGAHFQARRANEAQQRAAATPEGFKATAVQISPDGDVSTTLQREPTIKEQGDQIIAKGIASSEAIDQALSSTDPKRAFAELLGKSANENLTLKQQQAAMRQKITAANAILRRIDATPEEKAAAVKALTDGLGVDEDEDDAEWNRRRAGAKAK